MKRVSLILVFLSAFGFAQTEETIISGNSKLHYKTFGKGKPILIINGGPGMDCEGFEYLAKEIAKKNYQTIIYDQRGTGKSILKTPNNQTITMDLMAEDIENLRKHLKIEKWTILGHSFGGILTTFYATKHPETIEKIIFSSSGGVNLKFMDYVSGRIRANLTQEERDSLAFYQRKRDTGDSSENTNERRAYFLSKAYVYNKSKSASVSQRMTQTNLTINMLVLQNLQRIRFDCANSFADFKQPVLVLQGKNDIISTETAQEIATAFPNSKLVLMDNCAHYGWIDAKELYFNSIQKFLTLEPKQEMKHYDDNFAHQHLPSSDLQPDYVFLDLPQFNRPEILNCVEALLDNHIKEGRGNNSCIRTFETTWTYQDLYEKANQIAHVLVEDLGLKSGNRVLIRSANNPMMVAVWYAVLKAGGIVVATMPLLRAKELTTIIDCAEISHAICDNSLADEMHLVKSDYLQSICFYGNSRLEELMVNKPKTFTNYHTKSDSIALIGFTSGTTGLPKMTSHFHKDILNICETFPQYSLQPTADDIFTGSPPLGFTFGLGGLVLFPMYFGASTFLIEKPTPDMLLQAIQDYKITICFTAPTAWRIITTKVTDFDISSLRKCVSAGETLPLKVWQDWYDATGLKIIDGIGATEMLHIFISSNEDNMKPGATGVAITGYEAKIVDKEGNDLPANEPGRLVVRGVTGCKYLNRPEKQKEYVENGWNVTGDIFRQDEEGYFWFVARGDDMIISSGYNIAAIEVESVLLTHEEILECAVVGLPDEERGMLVCAHIVLKEQSKATDNMKNHIQHWFKEVAAPYKYPRVIYFTEALPKTETGKIQRFKLK